MKLLRKLGTRIINNKLEYWGTFLCPVNKEEIEMRLDVGKKAKSCSSHKNMKHGGFHNKEKLYKIWNAMKKRCFTYKNKYYGAKGITICNEWLNKENGFINFRNWALSNGYKEGLLIDRFNPNGNYEPSNCRFLTILESNRNKTNTITMEIANEIRELYKTGDYTQQELAEKFNISRSSISLIVNNKQWKTND